MTSFGDELSKKLRQLSFPARLDINNLIRGKNGTVQASEDSKQEENQTVEDDLNNSSNGFDSPRSRPYSTDSRKSTSSKSLFKSKAKIVPVESTPEKRLTKSSLSSKETAEGRRQISLKFSCSDEAQQDEIECEKRVTVSDRLIEIAEELNRRTEKAKEYVTQPPTPSTGSSERDDLEAPKPPPLKRTLTFIQEKKSLSENFVEVSSSKTKFKKLLKKFKESLIIPETIEPQSRLNISWLFIACCSYVYNAWMIPMRSVFGQYQTKENLPMWLAFDYLCDFVYIIDILVFKMRVKFLNEGTWMMGKKDIRIAYLKSYRFAVDLLSLLPLDLLYLYFGPFTAFRFPRMFKISVFWEFFERVDSVLSKPFIARLIRSVFYMVYSIHVYALVYYGFSKYEGIGSNSWVFQGEGNAYIRCYFFAIKTATSIGKNPKPVNVQEQALMTVAWLSGVFLFAVLIGQVKDIVLTASKNQNDYRRTVDETINYLNKYNVPSSVIDKVRLWFSYTWKTQKTLDEIKALKYLPVKLQLDLAINVHINTLSKVQLFQDCDENLLRDLVLKLKPVIYLPGDYVCRKGEVGKEMYIVKTGQVQVVGGPKGDTVFVTLSEGSVFGEISLLALAGGNRRTADVRSHGFSNLFVLSKEDLETTIIDHPEAQRVLKKKASKLIKDTKEREKSAGEKKAEESPQKGQTKSPKFLSTVFQMAPRGSIAESLRVRSIKLKTNPSLDRKRETRNRESAKNRLKRNTSDSYSDEDYNDEVLIIETERKASAYQNEQRNTSESPTHSLNSSSYELHEDNPDHDEWIESIYGNPEDSFQILKSLNENINFIPEEDRVTYFLTSEKTKDDLKDCKDTNGNSKIKKDTDCLENIKERTLCLRADNLIKSLDNLNEVSKPKPKKRKGIIDLGGSEESEDWTQNFLDSSKDSENCERKNNNEKNKKYIFESSSSRESFDNFSTGNIVPSFSSDSEVNKF